MLVEDDNNLREIYGARLLAEGYEIVSAKDGEEALALAVKEKPDLIISDIMMPKISGFDMLDILRSTAETKHTKVIMMTALSQVEDKERADRLGADRYLIKSQVTLEDVAKAAKEVLGEGEGQGVVVPSAAEPAPIKVDTPNPTPVATPVAEPVAEPVQAPTPTPMPTPTPVVDTPAPALPATDAPAPNPTPVATPVAEPVQAPTPTSTGNRQLLATTIAAMGGTPTNDSATTPDPTAPANTPQPQANVPAPGEISKTSVHTKVINPINDITQQGSDLEKLLAEEEAKEASAKASTGPVPVVNDLTPPELLAKQAEEQAEAETEKQAEQPPLTPPPAA